MNISLEYLLFFLMPLGQFSPVFTAYPLLSRGFILYVYELIFMRAASIYICVCLVPKFSTWYLLNL